MADLERPSMPSAGKVTHHTAEVCWDEALDRANDKLAQKGDTRIRVQLQEQDKNGGWNNVYTGYAKNFTVDNVEPWTTYTFRIRFVTDHSTSEWSPEVSITTAKEPMTGEHIHKAIARQDTAELERVLELKEAPIDAFDKYGFSPLMQAAQKGYLDMVEMLIENGADVNLKNDNGKTPLMMAAFAGRLDSAKELRYRGATYEPRDNGGSNALHWAMDGANLELIDYFIEDGADLTATDQNGWTPLLRIAAMSGKREVASLLLRAGTDVNARDKDGKTALMIAVVNGHQGMVELLLENKVDITAQNEFGKTAYQMAVSMEKRRVAKAFEEFMEKNGIKYN